MFDQLLWNMWDLQLHCDSTSNRSSGNRPKLQHKERHQSLCQKMIYPLSLQDCILSISFIETHHKHHKHFTSHSPCGIHRNHSHAIAIHASSASSASSAFSLSVSGVPSAAGAAAILRTPWYLAEGVIIRNVGAISPNW